MLTLYKYKNTFAAMAAFTALNIGALGFVPLSATAASPNQIDRNAATEAANNNESPQQGTFTMSQAGSPHQCGSGDSAVKVSINMGCRGEACVPGGPGGAYCTSEHSAVVDMTFAIIRFLSTGAGLVIVASVIWAGIQYSMSKGDPSAMAEAIARMRSAAIALLIFIFAYAILNYVIPAGFFI